ncbi:MAG: class I SAM-dependent rRNA methyltransferase [Bacteroidales bacterium]|nr:class I SAM-dependent rRNA methyltransferase [Bacteroidales bacterium]MDZ4204551.1 class I SAM-dependent rRNA methyltransferase [Bacteroidales bacterium]
MQTQSNHYPRVILKKNREASIQRFHPWVFSGAIYSFSREINVGEVVEIFSSSDDYLATGHFEGGSIAVKILTFDRQAIDVEFWTSKLQTALKLRQLLGLAHHPYTNAYRLVFTEGDGLPGLIIDYYNGVAVIQAQSAGMFKARTEITKALQTLYKKNLKAVYDKSPATMFGDQEPVRTLFGTFPPSIEIIENGHRFVVDVEKGQKTGFYLDQRDNRQLLAGYSLNRNVLNLFSYTGGFSVYAVAAGAKSVVSVDSSATAIAGANQNILLNNPDSSKHHGVMADVKEYVVSMDDGYDLVILDPPAFAKHQDSRHKAMLGYRYLNETVLKKMPAGGILFTFSCSQVVGQELFQSTVTAAAIAAGRQVKIIHKLTHPADHPVSIFHPEGEYLKGLVLYVE